jgi:hypothetical protein
MLSKQNKKNKMGINVNIIKFFKKKSIEIKK